MSLINQLSINSQIQIEIQGLIRRKVQSWYGQVFFAFTNLELKNLYLILIGDAMNTCPRLNRNLSLQKSTTFATFNPKMKSLSLAPTKLFSSNSYSFNTFFVG